MTTEVEAAASAGSVEALPRSLPAGLSQRGLLRALANLGRVALLMLAALGLVGIRNPTSIEQYATGIVLCLAAGVATLGMRRNLVWVVLYLIAFAAFSYVRAAADETGIAPRFDYVLSIERALPGTLPTIWLQDRLWSPGVSILDRAMVLVHFSYFIVPHAVALAIWRWRPQLTSRYVAAAMITLYGATLFAALVPTAPPWMAARAGLIPEVVKVGDWVYGDVGVQGYTREIVYMNPVAAMPSLHFAMTTLALLGISQFGRTATLAGAVYALSMGFALVYLGEHYLSDVLAGGLFAVGVWLAAGAMMAARSRSPKSERSGAIVLQ